MNVTSKDFTAQFKGIKAEVLAIKQAHEYGLGRVDLPTYTWSTTIGPESSQKTLILEIEFYKPKSQPILQQIYTQNSLSITFAIVDYTDGIMTLSTSLPNWSGFNIDYEVIFSATTPITNITWRVE